MPADLAFVVLALAFFVSCGAIMLIASMACRYLRARSVHEVPRMGKPLAEVGQSHGVDADPARGPAF